MVDLQSGSQVPEMDTDSTMTRPTGPVRAWWHALRLRPRFSLRQLLLGIAVLAVGSAIVAHHLKIQRQRQRAAISRALFQPLVQRHTLDSEQFLDYQRLCQGLMIGQARACVGNGVRLVQLL